MKRISAWTLISGWGKLFSKWEKLASRSTQSQSWLCPFKIVEDRAGDWRSLVLLHRCLLRSSISEKQQSAFKIYLLIKYTAKSYQFRRATLSWKRRNSHLVYMPWVDKVVKYILAFVRLFMEKLCIGRNITSSLETYFFNRVQETSTTERSKSWAFFVIKKNCPTVELKYTIESLWSPV